MIVKSLTLFFSEFVLLIVENWEESPEKNLDWDKDLNETAKVVEQVLSSIDEDCRVNRYFRITHFLENSFKQVGNVLKLIVTVAFDLVVELEVNRKVSDSRKTEDLDHHHERHALSNEFKVFQEENCHHQKDETQTSKDNAFNIETWVVVKDTIVRVEERRVTKTEGASELIVSKTVCCQKSSILESNWNTCRIKISLVVVSQSYQKASISTDSQRLNT